MSSEAMLPRAKVDGISFSMIIVWASANKLAARKKCCFFEHVAENFSSPIRVEGKIGQ
jgi:hypothetical protein